VLIIEREHKGGAIMLRNQRRTCDICDEMIPAYAPFRVGLLNPVVAARLMDVDDPELLPKWTQLADGSVQIEMCLECIHSFVGEIYNAVEVRYQS
jgi:hypothetical protein